MNGDPQIIIENGIEYIYQPILFKPEIMQEYYVGNTFVGMENKDFFVEGELSGMMQVGGMDGFMPELVKEIANDVIGVNNQIYDGYDFSREEGRGIDMVNFYFLIKKSEYSKAMENINGWSILKGLDHLIRLDVKQIQHAQPVI